MEEPESRSPFGQMLLGLHLRDAFDTFGAALAFAVSVGVYLSAVP